MKLKCIKSLEMKGENVKKPYIAFTEGKEYNARKGSMKGTNEDPYAVIRVLRARNEKGESHIIKNLESDELDDFFNKHFKTI